MAAARQQPVIRGARVLLVVKVMSVASVQYAPRVHRVRIRARGRRLLSVRAMSTRSARPSRVRNVQVLS